MEFAYKLWPTATRKALRTHMFDLHTAGRQGDLPLGDRTQALEVTYENFVRKLRTQNLHDLHTEKNRRTKISYEIFVRKVFAVV